MIQKVFRNRWQREGALERASILRAAEAPEGFDVERLRAPEAGTIALAPGLPQLLGVFAGSVVLALPDDELQLRTGVTAYVPPVAGAKIAMERGAELVLVRAPSPDRARGTRLIVRDERFVAACAADACALRWIFTPQYLSRRIFLRHDPILLSRSGHPVSWFHTTMFDVRGLPPNQDGEPVFKMSYNSRTELNVVHDVAGEARVRMALFPYRDREQTWSEWHPLDGDATYCLNDAEPVDGLRNKHEVYSTGHVSLFCLFDPAPVGIERHRPGEYSDYEPFAEVSARPEYAVHERNLARFDAMVDHLSLEAARDRLDAARSGPEWALFEAGRAAQRALEERMLADNAGRREILARFTLSA